MEKKYLIDAALLQAIAEYLAQRPFREVRRLIEAIEQCPPALEAPPEPAAKDKR